MSANDVIANLKEKSKAAAEAARKAVAQKAKLRAKAQFEAQIGPDENEPMVHVVALRSIAQFNGANRRLGEDFHVTERAAEKLIADGEVRLFDGKVDLKDAVKAIRAAGGNIDCDKGNAALVQIFAELDAEDQNNIGSSGNVNAEPDISESASMNDIRSFAKAAGIEVKRNASKAKIIAQIKGAGFKVGD